MASFTKRWQHEGEVDVCYLISPSTMDSADTVDITALLQGRTVVNVSAWDTNSAGGDSVTATYVIATDVITVDAAGATTDHVYVIKVELLKI